MPHPGPQFAFAVASAFSLELAEVATKKLASKARISSRLLMLLLLTELLLLLSLLTAPLLLSLFLLLSLLMLLFVCSSPSIFPFKFVKYL